MNIIVLSVFYSLVLILVGIFSWGFVDANMPIRTVPLLYEFVVLLRPWAAVSYVALQALLFVGYILFLYQIYRKRMLLKHVIVLMSVSAAILLFSFPGFSYDVFNYIATAKITFLYRENPYLIMPIDIPNEPMLRFLHASNKVALYGPVWIALTGVPYILGFNNLLLTIGMFKLFAAAFYVGVLSLVWKRSKSAFSVAFFGLNPLVLIETLGSGHNDIVMMFFALLSFELIARKRWYWSLVALLASILIKFATVFLLPVYVVTFAMVVQGKPIRWESVWRWCAIVMYMIFFLSPIREEIYAWYLLWPLTFVALGSPWSWLQITTLGFAFGLPLRFAPFVYHRNWGGVTPLTKKLVTFIPPAVFMGLYAAHKKK
ncbi:hypothetical protein HY948_04830 [Candidatus Gottesmanbacteria bacterium]|nr:hypothetical protein [Candidatus Gottesmanbacteria bacterium]